MNELNECPSFKEVMKDNGVVMSDHSKFVEAVVICIYISAAPTKDVVKFRIFSFLVNYFGSMVLFGVVV
jgi:hypothetical protein